MSTHMKEIDFASFQRFVQPGRRMIPKKEAPPSKHN